MPIDPSMLAKSIGTLTDLDPQRDLAATLHQAVVAARQLFDADAAGVMLVDIDGQLRWASASDERARSLEDNQEVFAAGPCREAYTSGRPAVIHAP
jgi:hypothetical protein